MIRLTKANHIRSSYVAQLGDSITCSNSFWTPLRRSKPERYLEDDGLPKTPASGRWRDVIRGARDKGPENGSAAAWRVDDVLNVAHKVLERRRPAVALIMVGTHDVCYHDLTPRFGDSLSRLVEMCLEAECIPVLNTIPPMRLHETRVCDANAVVRDVAREFDAPLVDFHAECLKRRPRNTWDGTLISHDGIHPSAGAPHVFSETNLYNSGYALRNWLNFLKFRELYFGVISSRGYPRLGSTTAGKSSASP